MDGTAEQRLIEISASLELLTRRLSEPGARFLSVKAAAAYASLSADSVRRLIQSGKLNGYKPVSGKVLVDRRELEACILASTGRVRHGRGHSRRGAAE